MLTRLSQPLHEFIHISGAILYLISFYIILYLIILYLNLLESYIGFDDELYCHKWISI